MSIFCDRHISQKGFARLPKVGVVPSVPQLKGSLDLGSGDTTSHLSAMSSRRTSRIEEGDLITGTIDITHERAHMLSAIQDPNRTLEKSELVCAHLSLISDRI